MLSREQRLLPRRACLLVLFGCALSLGLQLKNLTREAKKWRPGLPAAVPSLKNNRSSAKLQIGVGRIAVQDKESAGNATGEFGQLTGPNVCSGRCCSGWSVAPKTKKCTKPQCTPRCLNGGTCKQPQKCVCKPGFEGSRCDRAITTAAPVTTLQAQPTNPILGSVPNAVQLKKARTEMTDQVKRKTPGSEKKLATVRWQPLTLKEAQSVLQKKSSAASGASSKMVALLSKHVEAERNKLLLAGLMEAKGTRVKTIRTPRGEYTIHRTPVLAANQSMAGEHVKVLFTPTICKIRCTNGRCANHCEKGNMTTLYSTENGHSSPGAGFRVFLCRLLCQNGGICIQQDRCLCPPTFTGRYCQIPTTASPSSNNEIEAVSQNDMAVISNGRLVHSVHTLPLQSHQHEKNENASMVNVHVQHPPEANVKIHQVLRVRGRQALPSLEQSDSSFPRVSEDNRNALTARERNSVLASRTQERPIINGRSSETLGHCFTEVRSGQCSSPLPGTHTQDACCQGSGLAWGIAECALCPSFQGNGSRGDAGCPRGFRRINGTQCVDINECLEPGFCRNGDCVNTRGSYTCICKPGFLLDTAHGRCISHHALSEVKGQCYRVLKTGFCSLPLLRNITKQVCCCSRVGKAWGRTCDRCPAFGSEAFKEICPAGPGYHYSVSNIKINLGTVEHGAGASSHGQGHGQQTTTTTQASVTSPIDSHRTRPKEEERTFVQASPFPLDVRDVPYTPETSVCDSRPHICGSGTCVPLQGSRYLCECHPGYQQVNQQAPCVDVDECRETPNPCTNSHCENTAGSYRCVCSTGFRMNPQRTKCIDIDECRLTPSLCSNGRCENSAGSYKCLCLPGFRADAQGTRCTDIDECRQTPSICSNGRCENIVGSYRCVCPTGFRLDRVGNKCTDVDECQQTPSICSNGRCENSVGSYRCTCNAGFKPSLQGAKCADVDECQLNPSICANGRCENTVGSYRCVCATGFKAEPQDARCIDINECQQTPGICPNGHCENKLGSYRCACSSGFRLEPDGTKCVDINECQISAPCGSHGRCLNSEGSYRCECKPGYRMDGGGQRCTDINECFEGDFCFPNGECLNTEGSYSCLCSPGYKLGPNGSLCVDIDECTRSDLCQDGHCINTEGSFECSCKTGFAANPERNTCLDLDECAESRGAVCASQRCENTIGSYRCIASCEPGHRLTASGACIDINECVNATICGDHAFCRNLMGTYQCLCDQGYESAPDGKSCTDINECQSMQGVCGTALCENMEGSFLCICAKREEEFDPHIQRCVSRELPAVPDSGLSSPSVINWEGPSTPRRANVTDCYYNINDPMVCSNVLAQNITKQECCCTIEVGWGTNCQISPCPTSGTAEYLALCPHGRGYIPSPSDPFEYIDVNECALFGSRVCKNGLCINNEPGYSCYCNSGYYYDATVLECVDNNECLEEGACLGSHCVNTVGSYYCTCQPPQIYDPIRRVCVSNTSQSVGQDENLSICWVELGENLECRRILMERQTTFTECCCLYGEAWSLECALCPDRNSVDYELMCNMPRPPGFDGPFTLEEPNPYSEAYIRQFERSYPGPYGPGPYDDPSSRGGISEYVRPGYGDYSSLRGRVEGYRGAAEQYTPAERPYERRGSSQRFGTEGYEEDPSYESLPPETGPVLVDPVYEPGGRQSSRTGFGSRSSQSAGPPVVPIEPQPGEPWLQYRPRERVPYQEYPGQPLRRTRTESFERRYEGYEGLSADECGILHGCENGRCIRVPEGYTCDCYDGYQLEMTTMACIDINECDEADDPATLCMNGQCVNTDGSYRCVCLRGFIMSLQPNYCIPALPQE
ncbi:latent-transforming growth factor beta-binding protein 1-like [Erpetoichthys calabaricus]|uniref:latent-transforming growth factor beta-binding protein 1-like n=1 Tax=Erpetoichthys calabaricus TaxID=27687 RepID=UPI0022346392|nr:latent-transforming growth factor beta-binding protein 1-like [Erpetoichthys calabaricus]